MNDSFLETRQVVKRYANHTALDGVSITVPEGQVFGLLGPNGAGKTTLIRIINRITAPDAGEVCGLTDDSHVRKIFIPLAIFPKNVDFTKK